MTSRTNHTTIPLLNGAPTTTTTTITTTSITTGRLPLIAGVARFRMT